MTAQRPGNSGQSSTGGGASVAGPLTEWPGSPASRWDFEELENAEPRPLYLILMRLTNKGRRIMRYAPQKMFEINHEVEQHGCEIVAQYSLLGGWDFATIVNAKDNGTVYSVAQALGARGDLKTITLPAIKAEDFIRLMKKDMPKRSDG